MPFKPRWTTEADRQFKALKAAAVEARKKREEKGKDKSSQVEGLFAQVVKTLNLLLDNPKHPGLNIHHYSGLSHPWSKKEKVWEAYAQNKTPGAYRVFWCFGPKRDEITIIAITPHP